jgi:hypothetical protein
MRSNEGFSYFALFFMVAWTGMTVVPSAMALSGITRQLRAMLYPSVEGTIVHSGVAAGQDSDGDPTYRFSVRYTYEVDGQRHESTQYRYSSWATASRGFVEQLVARFPERSPVRVYYRPGAPGDAVLLTGLQGTDLMVLLVMTPFIFVMVGGWYTLVRRRRVANAEIRSFERAGRTHVTLRETAALITGLFAAGGCAFLVTIILAVAWGGDPPVQPVLMAWVLVTAVGVAITRRMRLREKQGRYDLIFDRPRGKLTLPPGPERLTSAEVGFGDITAVKCVPHTYKDDEGDTQLVWRPILELKSKQGPPRAEVIAQWSDQSRAQALTDWLRSHLRL